MRNVQLAILSVPLGLCTAFVKDGSKISEHGFLHGYDSFVWFTVAQNALGGLLVAVVVAGVVVCKGKKTGAMPVSSVSGASTRTKDPRIICDL